MKATVIAVGLLACQIIPAHSETEFQINCPGRATMTVSRAAYGLSTLMWPQHHFQVAAGQKRARLDDGDKIAITRFRNGDQLIANKNNGEIFFVYSGSEKLLPCSRTEKRDNDVIPLARYDASQHDAS